MLAEEKLAIRFLREKKITPPIDIRAEVKKLADIQEVDLPGSADAVLLATSPKRDRPLILLRAQVSSARKTFTLAHELGHIWIPWHSGTFVCHTDFQVRVPDHIYSETEREANRFASEVLMPTSWVQSIIKSEKTIGDMILALRTAGTSNLAASFSLIRNLAPGYVFAEVDVFGVIELSGRSPKTYVSAPEVGTNAKSAHVNSISDSPEKIETSNGAIWWWKLKRLHRPDPTEIVGDSRAILEIILTANVDSPEQRTKLRQSVNGIVGSANNKAQGIPVDLYTVLRGRFLNRDKLAEVTSHPLFEAFLARKAEEIEAR